MRNFILGTDWWTDCDDAVAVRILARAHKAGKIRLLGIGLNACMEYSVAGLEGFLNLEGVREMPIGVDLAGDDFGGNPPYQKRLSQYAERYRENTDAEDAVRLYRRLLAGSEEPVEIVEIGFLQVIAGVLESGADDISEKSVKELRFKASKNGIEVLVLKNTTTEDLAAALGKRCGIVAVCDKNFAEAIIDKSGGESTDGHNGEI